MIVEVSADVLHCFREWRHVNCHWLKVVNNQQSLVVTALDRFDDSEAIVTFKVTRPCLHDVCNCVHKVCRCAVQLKPYRMFVECFFRGLTGPDWESLLHGSVFGFRAINSSFNESFEVNFKPACNDDHMWFLSKKINDELAVGGMSKVDYKPVCTHNVFCIPKASGAACGI